LERLVDEVRAIRKDGQYANILICSMWIACAKSSRLKAEVGRHADDSWRGARMTIGLEE
jgi:hypothetical protein